jgi:hypothetical protein
MRSTISDISDEAVSRARTAITNLYIGDNGRWDNATRRYTEPTRWFLVDTASEEPEVNWTGDLLSEHASLDEARTAFARAVLEASLKEIP